MSISVASSNYKEYCAARSYDEGINRMIKDETEKGNTGTVQDDGTIIIQLKDSETKINIKTDGTKFLQLGGINPLYSREVIRDKRVTGTDGEDLFCDFDSGKISQETLKSKLSEIADDYIKDSTPKEEKTKIVTTIMLFAKGANSDATRRLNSEEAFAHNTWGGAYYNSDYYYKYEDSQNIIKQWAKEYCDAKDVQNVDYNQQDSNFNYEFSKITSCVTSEGESLYIKDLDVKPPKNLVLSLNYHKDKNITAGLGNKTLSLGINFQHPEYRKEISSLLSDTASISNEYLSFLSNVEAVDNIAAHLDGRYRLTQEGRMHPQLLKIYLDAYSQSTYANDVNMLQKYNLLG